jgi:CRISPR/Cas system-associated exonuclease Cas4 (RecB family)
MEDALTERLTVPVQPAPQRRRGTPCVSVTNLAKVMVGDTACLYAVWFNTHYYTPSEHSLALVRWRQQHTLALQTLAAERRALGEVVTMESANRFTVSLPQGNIVGRADLVTGPAEGPYVVRDAKSGEPRDYHFNQIQLYQWGLARTHPRYHDQAIAGCIHYVGVFDEWIPPETIDAQFEASLLYFAGLVLADEPPPRVPSPGDCRFCPIARHCPDRWGEPPASVNGEVA